MKTYQLFLSGILSTILFVSCEKKDVADIRTANASITEEPYAAKKGDGGTCNPNAYNVVLESKTFNGADWEWTWSVQNSNPGNGNDGTVQDLSHWGMQFGTCFNWASVVGAAYSDDGTNWTSFPPVYESDPSQSCLTTPVLKFDHGTTGSQKTYYKLILNFDYAPGATSAYYKSGGSTGCCTFTFTGPGCEVGPDR